MKRTQSKRASFVEQADYIKNPKTLLAIAVSQRNRGIRGGGILYNLESQNQVDSWLGETSPAPYPYISTFLSLQNKPSLIKVINAFRGKFDLVLVEGAGVQHPRHFGLACELGVDLDIPVIGIIKNSLWGEINMSSPIEIQREKKHDISPVYDGEKLLAYFIRRKQNKKGIFLSIGHKISLPTAVDIILPLLKNNLPEPLRLVKSLLKKY